MNHQLKYKFYNINVAIYIHVIINNTIPINSCYVLI